MPSRIGGRHDHETFCNDIGHAPKRLDVVEHMPIERIYGRGEARNRQDFVDKKLGHNNRVTEILP